MIVSNKLCYQMPKKKFTEKCLIYYSNMYLNKVTVVLLSLTKEQQKNPIQSLNKIKAFF